MNSEQKPTKGYNSVTSETMTSVLTPRQKEVLDLLSSGLQNKEIAFLLKIKEVTIKIHIASLMRRLGARNRTMAVVTAQKMGLLP